MVDASFHAFLAVESHESNDWLNQLIMIFLDKFLNLSLNLFDVGNLFTGNSNTPLLQFLDNITIPVCKVDRGYFNPIILMTIPQSSLFVLQLLADLFFEELFEPLTSLFFLTVLPLLPHVLGKVYLYCEISGGNCF